MKKFTILKFGLLIGMLVTPIDVSADESVVYKQKETNDIEETKKAKQIVSEMFSELADSEKVLELSDGGFLSGPGEAIVYELNDKRKTVTERYNVDTDSKAETVAEAKKRLI